LAEATRLRLLRLLERHELGVSDLVDVLRLPQSSISRHLKLLVDRGWITGRSQGSSNLYALRLAELPPGARRLWQAVREQANSWPAARQDELRLARRLAERIQVSQAYFARSAREWDRLRRELYGAVFGDAALRGLLPRDWSSPTWPAARARGRGAGPARGAGRGPRPLAGDAAGGAQARQRAGQRRPPAWRAGAAAAGDRLLRRGPAAAALAYVSDPAQALAEAARILKPGGRLAVVDLLAHDSEDFRLSSGQQRRGFDPEELAGLVRAAGFAPDNCARFRPSRRPRGPPC